MEIFLLSFHYIQHNILSYTYIFQIKLELKLNLVSFKNIEVWSNFGQNEFGQKRVLKYYVF